MAARAVFWNDACNALGSAMSAHCCRPSFVQHAVNWVIRKPTALTAMEHLLHPLLAFHATGQVGGARRPGGSRGGSGRMAIDDDEDDDIMAGGSGRGGRAAVRVGADADEDEDLAGLVDDNDVAAARQQQQRRRVEVRRGGGGSGGGGGGGSGGGAGGGGAAGGRPGPQHDEWDHGLELPEGEGSGTGKWLHIGRCGEDASKNGGNVVFPAMCSYRAQVRERKNTTLEA